MMSVGYVTSFSQTYKNIKDHTLGRNLTNVMFVIKDLRTGVTLRNIVEYIREFCLTNVMFVEKGFQMEVVMLFTA
jgi:hypothetical protein